MSQEGIASTRAPGAARSSGHLAKPALVVAGVGAALTTVAPFLAWIDASVSVGPQTTSLSLRGTDDEGNGRFALWLGVAALIVVAVVALDAVRPVWVLLPIDGVLVLLLVWASLRKVQNTVDETISLTGGSDPVKMQIDNGIGLWVTLVGGVLLLATAVLVPVLRRRAVASP